MLINMVVDLQFGSTGKGLLCGYLAETLEPDAVVTCNMPNAGHTYLDRLGNTMIHKILPNGVVSPKLEKVFIGPGCVFSLERLSEEIKQAKSFGYMGMAIVIIHPNAMLLKEHHAEIEQATLSGIASTMQGSAAAMIEKIMRQQDIESSMAMNNAEEISDVLGHSCFVARDVTHWQSEMAQVDVMLAEGSQGYSLGHNQGFWPFCTSRECTPMRFMSDMGLPNIKPVVWGTLRCHPIRVGNTPDGYSGDYYADQRETSWEDLGQTAETTTVTGRVRRVFTFSNQQLREALWEVRPDHLFLNFANYMTPTTLSGLLEEINAEGDITGVNVDLIGYGPTFYDVVEAG